MRPLINPDNTCCFTGHRPGKLPWKYNESDPRCQALKEKLYDVCSSLYASGIRHFICGMALGCDMYFAETVLQLREEHPDISLEAAIPCETQAQNWTEAQRNRYFTVVAQCDDETLVSRPYTPTCMTDRNKYMVNHASVLIAVSYGTFGGTMQTLNYAKKKGLEIIEISPS